MLCYFNTFIRTFSAPIFVYDLACFSRAFYGSHVLVWFAPGYFCYRVCCDDHLKKIESIPPRVKIDKIYQLLLSVVNIATQRGKWKDMTRTK